MVASKNVEASSAAEADSSKCQKNGTAAGQKLTILNASKAHRALRYASCTLRGARHERSHSYGERRCRRITYELQRRGGQPIRFDILFVWLSANLITPVTLTLTLPF